MARRKYFSDEERKAARRERYQQNKTEINRRRRERTAARREPHLREQLYQYFLRDKARWLENQGDPIEGAEALFWEEVQDSLESGATLEGILYTLKRSWANADNNYTKGKFAKAEREGAKSLEIKGLKPYPLADKFYYYHGTTA